MITSLLNADYLEEERIQEEGYRDMKFQQEHRILYEIKQWFWWSIPACFHRNVTCKIYGHKIHMDGHAGPDSGYEEWWCERWCGYGGHHIYY